MHKVAFKTAMLLGLGLLLTSPVWGREEAKSKEKTIVEIAVGNKNFTKLVAALKAADLVDALSGEGPFTVFAPTDAAFEALGEDTLKAVLADKKKLTGILTYHVIKGKVLAADALALAKDDKSATTLNGADIKLSIKDKSLYLNGTVKVIKTDIIAKNGVIHVIDKVLLPPTPGQVRKGAIQRIERCVEAGVALYNAGHHRECAALYHQTVVHLSRIDGDVMPTTAQRRLKQALAALNGCDHPRENAWILRGALDAVYDEMAPLTQAAR